MRDNKNRRTGRVDVCVFDARVHVRSGFTLIELLVTIGLVGVLIGMLAPALRSARESSLVTRELSTARQYAIAYQMFADDHRGYVLPARIDPNRSPQPLRDAPAIKPDGRHATGPQSQRWVWRLAPYLNYDLNVLFRDPLAREQLQENHDSYRMTLFPAFGLNEYFVGGRIDYYNSLYRQTWGEDFWVHKISDAPQPWRLFSFVSASAMEPGEGRLYEGYFRVEPPAFVRQVWKTLEEPSQSTLPNDTGFVWRPANERIISAHLDGHAKAYQWREALDMRHWAPKADAPTWRMPPPGR